MSDTSTKKTHFIRQMIESDLNQGIHTHIITRFPPEPNGYLHIGHAKSICLNFGMAIDYQGSCNLRFDDTNPSKEEDEFVHAIMDDVRWLGFHWSGEVRYASDYFNHLYNCAVQLVKTGNAYVDSLSAEEIREHRGTLQQPGRNSPYRTRSVEENLALFEQMKNGELPEGAAVLRAKIDMTSGNINMRDPVLYRIMKVHHQRTGDDWCIYPMYDYAHPLSDAIEDITHSLRTLEFQDHRPLYDWLVNTLNVPFKPKQTEFARLNVSHTLTSKRKLRELVEKNIVTGWNDPRLPTLQGMRRRGYPPAALRAFCEMTGISKSDSVIELSVLEECVRNELNQTAPRAMCVIDPIKVIIDNYPADKKEILTAANHPQDETLGDRDIPFSKEIYIDRDDFLENPPKKFFRLSPGQEVRLRNSYVIRCNEVLKDENGHVTEIHCSYDDQTLGKNPVDRKVKGVIHWVSAADAIDCEIRLYDRLFTVDNPGAIENYLDYVNPQSLTIIANAKLEPALKDAKPSDAFQFERLGYFCVDPESQEDHLVFNRVVGLRDSWTQS